MTSALFRRRGVGRRWTAADYDSYTVLAELNTPRPAARVTRARRGRPLRRAYRSVLRTVVLIPLARTAPIRKEATSR